MQPAYDRMQPAYDCNMQAAFYDRMQAACVPSVTPALGRNSTKTSNSSSPSAQQLLDYFVDKVASVRNSTGGSEASTVLPPTTDRLDQFVVCSAEDIQ